MNETMYPYIFIGTNELGICEHVNEAHSKVHLNETHGLHHINVWVFHMTRAYVYMCLIQMSSFICASFICSYMPYSYE